MAYALTAMTFRLSILGAVFLSHFNLVAETAPTKSKPTFQYKTEGVEISVPTADEPHMASFDAAAIKAAIKYLDDGSLAWVREKSCVNCHTTGPYMVERPALTAVLGAPLEEVREDFIKTLPDKQATETEKEGRRYYPGATSSVWRTLGLAEWDKNITGKLTEPTTKSLRDMVMRISSDGALVSTGEVEIPHITTDFELTLQAARAITVAPGWLEGLTEPELLQRIARMKSFLKESKPRNDYERILRLQLAVYMPDLVPQAQRDEALVILTGKQHSDGGWSLRDMSETHNWRTPMSDFVLKLIAGLPDAARPESDPYMTAFAVVLLRQNGVPAADPRIQRAVAWLKKEQRVSGRWWMHSLYRGNYHYITYIASMQAVKALALCDEIR